MIALNGYCTLPYLSPLFLQLLFLDRRSLSIRHRSHHAPLALLLRQRVRLPLLQRRLLDDAVGRHRRSRRRRRCFRLLLWSSGCGFCVRSSRRWNCLCSRSRRRGPFVNRIRGLLVPRLLHLVLPRRRRSGSGRDRIRWLRRGHRVPVSDVGDLPYVALGDRRRPGRARRRRDLPPPAPAGGASVPIASAGRVGGGLARGVGRRRVLLVDAGHDLDPGVPGELLLDERHGLLADADRLPHRRHGLHRTEDLPDAVDDVFALNLLSATDYVAPGKNKICVQRLTCI